MRRVAWVVALVACGCGGGAAETTAETHTEGTQGGEQTGAEGSQGLQISGLMGTIPAAEVNNALNTRMERFGQCFARRSGAVEVLGGRISMGFRIRTDGSVSWVFVRESSIGDLETERCILDVARATRFRPPTGGEAEAGWGFSYDAPDDVRPPAPMGADRLLTVLGEHGSEALARCRASGSGTFQVTAYVQPGGAVLAAGASASDHDAQEQVPCIVDAVRTWTLPDPGSYVGKVTFDLR